MSLHRCMPLVHEILPRVLNRTFVWSFLTFYSVVVEWEPMKKIVNLQKTKKQRSLSQVNYIHCPHCFSLRSSCSIGCSWHASIAENMVIE